MTAICAGRVPVSASMRSSEQRRFSSVVVAFVSSHSQITAQKFQALMLKKDDMAADVGSVVYGEEATV